MEMNETAATVRHIVTIVKDAERQLNDKATEKAINVIISGINTAARLTRGWKAEIQMQGAKIYSVTPIRDKKKTWEIVGYQYAVNIAVTCDKEPRSAEVEFSNIVQAIAVKGITPKWRVIEIDGSEYIAPSAVEVEVNMRDEVGYAPINIPETWSHNFAHLYGLDDHIVRVRKALDAAILSGWRHRFHVALIGPPGCGKSDIAGSVKRTLGEEAVLEFDGTSTTMAGAQKELADREELPRVLIIEEIEKAPEASLAWLLSILDLRGEVRKTTARGNILRDTKMLAIATVNDLATFNKANFGALQSRFANKVFFKRPTRELLAKILRREIMMIHGDNAWIEPALDYAEEIGTTDPREVVAIALAGREDLLTGDYQEVLRRTTQSAADLDINMLRREVA